MPVLLPDDGAVSLRAGIGGAIRLGACERPYAEDPYPFLDYAVEIRGGGVQASVLVRSLAGDDLPGFLRDLAAGVRGWPGARHWRSLEDQLRMDATHDGLGQSPFWSGSGGGLTPTTGTWPSRLSSKPAPRWRPWLTGSRCTSATLSADGVGPGSSGHPATRRCAARHLYARPSRRRRLHVLPGRGRHERSGRGPPGSGIRWMLHYRLNRPRTSSISWSSARQGRRVSASFTRPRTVTGSSAANRMLAALATTRSASCVTVKPLSSSARIAGITVSAAATRSTPSVRRYRAGTRIPAAGQPPAAHSMSGSP